MATTITTMTIADAKECVKYGAKITHELWSENEFITRHWRTGYLTNEVGQLLPAERFWAHFQENAEMLENGFKLYTDERI